MATGLCAILCAISYGMALAVYQPITVRLYNLRIWYIVNLYSIHDAMRRTRRGCWTRCCGCWAAESLHRSKTNCNISMSKSLLRMQNAEGLLDQALRVFGLLGAVLVAVIEIEWERLLQLVRFTEYWVGRAIVQARLGPLLLCLRHDDL